MNSIQNSSESTSKQPVVIVALVIALCLAADSMLYIALPIYWKEAGLGSLWEVGIILSINRFIRLPINPLIGWLYNRISLRQGLLIAVICALISNLGYGLANNLWSWIILRCIWGIAWSLLSLGGLLTVTNYSTEYNRGQLMGTYNGLYRLGSLFGMLLGGFLPVILGFSKMCLFFGSLAFFGIPLVLFFVSHDTVNNFAGKQGAKVFHRGLLIKPVIIVALSGLLLNMLFRGLINSTLSLVIKEHFASGLVLGGIVISAVALSGVIQGARWSWEPFLAISFGRWSDGPKGRLPLFLASLVIAALAFSFVPIKLPMALWIIVILVVMLCGTSLTTLMDSLASDTAKDSNSTISVMTVYSIAGDLGAALGPLISYLIIGLENGLIYSYSSASVILLIVAGLWYSRRFEDIKVQKY